ncbi:TonB-dependent receptor [Steroidobacter sp. S1-65]|uniref:TonB-dependent receptor n=1 Tax=Steroidobacter gossypii TaxID=2805490 RepID=A0ABS1X631_9GAMM|nr:TonB-dependent receptor [Steroidobacter gossypii]MBM0108668.1 TonB-dependent receptor [Steroidobacter gossypii]
MVAKQVIAGVVAAAFMGGPLPLAAQTTLAPSQGVTARSDRDEPPSLHYYTLDIPRLTIIEALKEFTTQTGLQISFWPDAQTDQNMLVGPLRGRFTAEVALTRLLASSGLAFRRTNDRSLVVMAPSLLGLPRNGSSAPDQERSRLAEGQPRLRAVTRPPEPEIRAQGAAGSSRTERMFSRESIDEVIVTGTRMERSGEGPAPVQVFTRREIEELGAASIPDVLRYTPQQPFTRPEYYYQNGGQYSQMRGIGIDTTLVLINGRRVVPTSNSLTLNAFDLNSIPLAAVEKIEVLSDSASAIYGADAMGGVINIVLRKEIPQPVLDVQYGSASGGGDLLRGSLSVGYATERFKASLIADYHQRDFLFGVERDRWRNQDFSRYGGIDYRTPGGAPANVRSSTGQNLPGLPSSFATVPEGSRGVGLTPDDFIPTAGMRNHTSTLSTLAIVPESRQRNLALFAEYELAPELSAFAEVLHTHRDVLNQDELPSVVGARVPANNPFNPFGQEVLVDFALGGIGPQRTSEHLQTTRGAAGLRGALSSGWQWEIAAVASTETDDVVIPNRVSDERVSAALAQTDPARALNPFVDGPGGGPELLASLMDPSVDHHFSRGRQVSAFMRGDLWELPAGPLQAVVGSEWRDERMVYDGDTESLADGRDVKALFTELRVPLLGSAPDANEDRLTMTLAARLDDYSDFGSTLNPQIGLMWRTSQELLLRGSYGTSFRPPSLFELHSPRISVSNMTVVDAARNDARSSVTIVGGGNPDLRPIEARSMTAGLVLTPSAVPDLRLLANYWKIGVDNRVTYLQFNSLLANEHVFSDRVLRDEPTPADIAAGIPGRLLQLDISRMNFGRLDTSGIDFEVSYDIATRWGDFTPRLSATWVNEFDSVDEPLGNAVNRVGVASVLGSVPRWRVIGGLGWKRNGLSASTTIDWLPGYMDANREGLTTRRLPSRILVDFQASLTVDEMFGPSPLWNDLKLQAGVRNAFDELPPFAEIGFSSGYDSSQGELIGRFGYLRLTKGF